MRVYLDSCVAIYLVEESEPWFSRVSAVLATGDFDPVVTELVRMECRVRPVRDADANLDDRFERFLALQALAPLTRGVFDRATRLRAEYRIPTIDALHIGAAIESGCEEFWTNDNRLDRVTLAIRVRAFAD